MRRRTVRQLWRLPDVIARIAPADPVIAADKGRLSEVRRSRRTRGALFRRPHAENWNRIRALHVSRNVGEAVREAIGDKPVQAALDLGAGTGRMLELIAPLAQRRWRRPIAAHAGPGAGADEARRTGMAIPACGRAISTPPPVERNAFDLIVVHQVLHYPRRADARDPRGGARAVLGGVWSSSISRRMRKRFARASHAHRPPRLRPRRDRGDDAGRRARDRFLRELTPDAAAGMTLTVSLWLGHDPRMIADAATFIAGGRLMGVSHISPPSPPSVSFEFFPPATPQMEATL